MSESVRPGGTYRTLDEQRETLSPAEERLERGRQTVELFLGPAVFLIMYLAPLPLEPAQHTLAAILSFVIVYWLSEAIPIPVAAVLALAICVSLGVASGDAVFGAFASPTIFLFIGGFIIAEAMMRHGLDRRFAFRVLSIPGASYGFMLPVSTPPNAIVYGSGMIPITKMVRLGIVFDIIGATLIVAGLIVMVRFVRLV